MLQNQTHPLSQFIVKVDNQLDLSYIEALEAELRKRAIHSALRDCKAFLGHAALASIKYLGNGTLHVIDELVQSTK